MPEADLARAVLAMAVADARSNHTTRSRAAIAWLSRHGNSELAFWSSLAGVQVDFVMRLGARGRRR